MKYYVFSVFLMSAASFAHANSLSNDFSRSTDQGQALSSEDLRRRFSLKGEVFVTDGRGKLLYQGSEVRFWKFGEAGDLVSNWSFQSPYAAFHVKHVWTISKDAKLEYEIQQTDSMKRKDKTREVVMGKILKKDKKTLENFSSVVWVVEDAKDRRVVIRLTPELDEKENFLDIKKFPVSLRKAVISDNGGRVWARGLDVDSRYIAITTHSGRLALSYFPFKGSKEIGFVRGNQIVVKDSNSQEIYLQSVSPILSSSDAAKIYGFVDLQKKTDSKNSVQTSTSENEEEFLGNL